MGGDVVFWTLFFVMEVFMTKFLMVASAALACVVACGGAVSIANATEDSGKFVDPEQEIIAAERKALRAKQKLTEVKGELEKKKKEWDRDDDMLQPVKSTLGKLQAEGADEQFAPVMAQSLMLTSMMVDLEQEILTLEEVRMLMEHEADRSQFEYEALKKKYNK
jgi:hypothetical protein